MADETKPSELDPNDGIDPTGPAEDDGTETTDGKAEDVEGLKAELEKLRKENARMRKGLHPVEPPAPKTVVPGIPGDGPVLWEGTLDGDKTAPVLTFHGSASEAEAREQYLVHAGITSTDKKVRVSKKGEESAPAEATAETEPKKPAPKKPAKPKK